MPAPRAPAAAARLVKAAHLAVMTAVFAIAVWAFGDIFIDSGQKIHYGWESRNWPATIGTVLTSEVEGAKRPTPRVRYRYALDGRVIHSGRLGNWWAYGSAHRFVHAFPAGAEVMVYHEPGGEVSVLERGVRVFDVVGVIVLMPISGFLLLLSVTAFHYLVTTPAAEQLALWQPCRARGRRRPLITPRSHESKVRADALMEAEIAERRRELAERKARE